MTMKRNSNYELMRIISMFLIVLYHVIFHGKLMTNYQNEGAKIILDLIVFASIIHVNSFVLVTGYFQSTSKFKQSKVWSLINASLFYRVIILIILSILGIIGLSKLEIVREVFPLDTFEYWFVKCYLFLYCISPFLNKAIENISKKDYQKMLLVLFVLFSIIPSITGGKSFNNDGYTLYQFIYIYLIGAYFRKFPLKDTYIFKPMSKKLYQIILITIFILSFIMNYVIAKFSGTINGINSILNQIGNNINVASLSYSNPLIIVQSIAYFSFFGTLDIKNQLINKLASLTIGVYLIHDNNFLRENIFKWLGIDNGPIYSYYFILYIILIAIIIYVGCSLIELLRGMLFKFIYNRKISKKIRDKYYNTLSQIQFIEPSNRHKASNNAHNI